jgi:hypothetical protein
MPFRFVHYIKDAIGKFYYSNPVYDQSTVKHIQDMLYHLRKRSDIADAWDGTYGILLKLKETGAPKRLIEFAQKQHDFLENVLEVIQ